MSPSEPVSATGDEVPDSSGDSRSSLAVGIGLTLAALVARVLFWRSSVDATWSYSAYYKGDAHLWRLWAESLREGELFYFGLPFRPPGAAYLFHWLWDGSEAGIATLKLAWCVMGALVVFFLHRAVLVSFGRTVAAIAGGACALSTSLMILSTSLNNETPYLLCVTASFWLLARIERRARAVELAAFGFLNALACLTRVEHALFFALALAWLSWVMWRREQARGASGAGLAVARRMTPVLGIAVLVLVPWHVKSWGHIAALNRGEGLGDSAALALVEAVEERVRPILWDEEARAEAEKIPGFNRRLVSAFVAATIQHRGKSRVRAEDLDIEYEAFGYRSEPMNAHPFVAIYGPLNFYLANNELASGGFNRLPLEVKPRLEGGRRRYPADLLQGMPPPSLSFEYPPHLHLFNRGYELGLEWIREHPADFLSLAARKLSVFWSGATLGWTGYGFPSGASGLRRQVDLVVPQHGLAIAIRVLVLVVALAGWASRRSRPELAPWLLFLASQLVVACLFFGYARHGALVTPVLALLVGLAAERFVVQPLRARGVRWLPALWGGALVLGLSAEAIRAALGVEVEIGGKPVVDLDPNPVDRFGDLEIRFRHPD